MGAEISVERRARIHAALGDPARLAIVDALALGDASPGEIAHRHGLALDPTGTAHITDVVHDGDLVIAVCDNAYEDLTSPRPEAGTVRPRLHWSIPDPVRVDTDAAFETAYTDIAGRIDRLAPTLTTGADHG
jgi:protein-tyrosine-phosphatase